MKEESHTKLGAYCSIALHATVALAAIVSIFAKAVFKSDEPPPPPVVFDMVEPASEPAPAPAAPTPAPTEIEQPKIEKIEKLQLPEPEPEPEPDPIPEPKPAPEPKPVPKPNPTPKPKPQKKVSYEEFLKKNPDKRNAKPSKPRTTTRKVTVGKVSANFSNIDSLAKISASATTGAAMKNELAAYTQYINLTAKRNWVSPQDVYEPLEAEISFKVSKNGVISDVRILKSSGNAAFDNSVVATFRAISLMPPPDRQPHTVTLTFRAD